MASVRIGRCVEYNVLERALIDAASEVRWRIEVEDKFETTYVLGSSRKIDVYSRTSISLRHKSSLMMTVNIFDKNPRSRFEIQTGSVFGNASDEEVKTYLAAIFRNLHPDT